MASAEDTQLLVHACEICGQEGFSESQLLKHVTRVHVDGCVKCPFCDLQDVTPYQMTVHVNAAHLEYLTPDCEQREFLEEGLDADFDNVWKLDEDAKEGLTNGVARSPSLSGRELAQRPSSSSDSTLSPMSIGTEAIDSSLWSLATSESQPTSLPLTGAIQKKARLQALPASNSRPSRDKLTIDVKPLMDIMLSCPMCSYQDADASRLQKHVNREHFDETSPSDATNSDALSCPFCSRLFAASEARLLEQHVNRDHVEALATPVSECKSASADSNGNLECPVCLVARFSNYNELSRHTESHFSGEAQGSSATSVAEQERIRRENERKKFEEKRYLDRLKSEYGMDDEGNYMRQAESGLERAVSRGQLSVVDYHIRQVELRQSQRSGLDDYRSATRGLVPRLRALVATTNSSTFFLCSALDHFASSEGDRGWGCGYRNIQMLLSSLTQDTSFKAALSRTGCVENGGIPSICRLQQLIERAWQKGFDEQGRDQLGGRLANTRKWIGATEVSALLANSGIRSEIVDFHRPTGPDGTHPELFNWVLDYFRSRSGRFAPPLYLQHQGHSRTIVGVEVPQRGGHRLIVFDPSNTKMFKLLSRNEAESSQVLKSLRKAAFAMKCTQYQIVAAIRTFSSEQEAGRSRILTSRKIP